MTRDDKPNTATPPGAKPDAEAIEKARAALRPLARISPLGERIAVKTPVEGAGDGSSPAAYSGAYRIRRCQETVTITREQIERAADLVADPKATLPDLRKALKPLMRLPVDPRIEDPRAPIYVFPADDGSPVEITNEIIRTAREAGECE